MTRYTSISWFIAIEVVVLVVNYLLIIMKVDFFLGLLGKTVILFSGIGVCFLIYFTVLKSKNMLSMASFLRYILLSIISIVIPPLFLFLLFSQLH